VTRWGFAGDRPTARAPELKLHDLHCGWPSKKSTRRQISPLTFFSECGRPKFILAPAGMLPPTLARARSGGPQLLKPAYSTLVIEPLRRRWGAGGGRSQALLTKFYNKTLRQTLIKRQRRRLTHTYTERQSNFCVFRPLIGGFN
jgi:hypothetical protein